jgi:hypothetical protein
MKKELFFFLLFFLPLTLISQDLERISIQGTVIVKQGGDSEGISIYNQSSNEGTVTNSTGDFQLRVAENDRMIITAIQYKSFDIVINEKVINTKVLSINLEAYVNELDEVVILKKDFKKGWDLSYETLEFGYDFPADAQSSITGNISEDAINSKNLENGINFKSLIKLILPKKKKSIEEIIAERNLIIQQIKEKYSLEYLSESLKIPLDQIEGFIYFIGYQPFDKKLLKSENEIYLLDYLLKQRFVYLKK